MNRLYSTTCIELAEQVGNVLFDRTYAEYQPRSDFVVGVTDRDEAQDFKFPFRQRFDQSPVWRNCILLDNRYELLKVTPRGTVINLSGEWPEQFSQRQPFISKEANIPFGLCQVEHLFEARQSVP